MQNELTLLLDPEELALHWPLLPLVCEDAGRALIWASRAGKEVLYRASNIPEI